MVTQQKKARHAAKTDIIFSFLKMEIVKDNVSLGVQIKLADLIDGSE